jgi:hypothetical protein
MAGQITEPAGVADMTQPASLICVHPASAISRRPSASRRPLKGDRLVTTACPSNCVYLQIVSLNPIAPRSP